MLINDNRLGRHLELWELPKGDKVASSGFLFLMVLAIIISQNIFYTPQIQVHPQICQTNTPEPGALDLYFTFLVILPDAGAISTSVEFLFAI